MVLAKGVLFFHLTAGAIVFFARLLPNPTFNLPINSELSVHLAHGWSRETIIQNTNCNSMLQFSFQLHHDSCTKNLKNHILQIRQTQTKIFGAWFDKTENAPVYDGRGYQPNMYRNRYANNMSIAKNYWIVFANDKWNWNKN